MTCIVGLVENGTVMIGGDSAGVAGYHVQLRADEKVFRNGEFIFGFTSSFRMGQLLRWKFVPPPLEKGESEEKYLHTRWIDGVIELLKNNGYAVVSQNELSGGTFLFGFRGKLYLVDSDFQIGQAQRSYDAVGCGAYYALGSLYSTDGLEQKRRVTEALHAASYFSAGVYPPFHFVSSPASQGVNF